MEVLDPSDVRSRILVHAIRLFGRKGYSATSVREVVAAAGVTKPTLYYYFENKEALFSEAVGSQLDGLRMLVDSILGIDAPVLERITVFLDLYVRGGLEQPDSVRLMMTATAPTEASQPRVATITRFQTELQRLEVLFAEAAARGELRSDLDPAMAVTLLIGAANSMLMSGLAGIEVPDDLARRLVSTLSEGLAP